MLKLLTPEGLSLMLRKIKTVFATKTEVNAVSESLANQSTQIEESCVHKTGNETIAGTKTFSSTISGSVSGSSASCTGNAATATKLLPQSAAALPTANLTQDGLQVVEVYNNDYPYNYGNVVNVQGTAHKGANQLFLAWSGTNNGVASIYYRNKRDAVTTWSDWKQIAFTDSSITGNAANVTGTVAIENGGTGAASRLDACKNLFNSNVGNAPTHFLTGTANFANSGYSTIADSKTVLGINNLLPLAGGTMTGQLKVNRDNGTNGSPGILLSGPKENFAIMISDTSITKGTAPSATKYMGIDFYGKDIDNYNKRLGMLEYGITAANLSSTYLRAYNVTTNTNTATCTIACNVDSSGTAYTAAPTPASGDNSTKIATTAFVKSAVSSGSDRRIKQDFADISDKFLDAWKNVKWTSFKLKNEVRNEDNASVHFGAIVQDMQDCLKNGGFNPDDYAFMYQLKYTDAEKDLASEISEDGIPNGEKWYLQYNEALAIEAAYQRRRADLLEKRLMAVESSLANILGSGE